MSLHDYQASYAPELRNAPFYALIMAAIRNADAINAAKLRRAFPDTFDELKARYNSPGGRLPTDGVPYAG